MMHFKVDENLPKEVAERLQAAGYEAETVSDEGLAGKPDTLIFAVCQQEQRTLIDKLMRDLATFDAMARVIIQVSLCCVLRGRNEKCVWHCWNRCCRSFKSGTYRGASGLWNAIACV